MKNFNDKKTWIICSGSINDYEFYKNKIDKSDVIVCADGGAVHAANMGIVPNVIIGDLDSISNKCYAKMQSTGVKFIKYSTDKDKTDTQLAFEYAADNGCTDIIFIGALGSRFDHSFANVSLLKSALDKKVNAMILNEKNKVYLINDKIMLKGNVGDKVSLLCITEKVSGITTNGLKYALKDSSMILGFPNGISNVFTTECADVSIKNGLLLVIQSKD